MKELQTRTYELNPLRRSPILARIQTITAASAVSLTTSGCKADEIAKTWGDFKNFACDTCVVGSAFFTILYLSTILPGKINETRAMLDLRDNPNINDEEFKKLSNRYHHGDDELFLEYLRTYEPSIPMKIILSMLGDEEV